MDTNVGSKPTSRRYSPELKERAVRLVLQLRAETGEKHGSVKRIAEQLDVGVESLRGWVLSTRSIMVTDRAPRPATQAPRLPDASGYIESPDALTG